MQCASQVTSIIEISQVMRLPWLSSGGQSRKNGVIIKEMLTRSLRDSLVIIVKNKNMIACYKRDYARREILIINNNVLLPII